MENDNYTENEVKVKNITIHDKNCIGCKKHNRFTMISYMTNENEIIHDLFLTKEQVEYLLKELSNIMKIHERTTN